MSDSKILSRGCSSANPLCSRKISLSFTCALAGSTARSRVAESPPLVVPRVLVASGLAPSASYSARPSSLHPTPGVLYCSRLASLPAAVLPGAEAEARVLPLELVEKDLLWLPVKSLIRFRCSDFEITGVEPSQLLTLLHHDFHESSVAADSLVHSSSIDDFIAYLDGALAAISPDASSDKEDENQDELESVRIKRRKFESDEETESSTSEGIVKQNLEESVEEDVCTHPGSFRDMCIRCGQKLDGESGVTFGYIHKDLRLHDEEISRLRNSDANNLRSRKKLYLMLDGLRSHIRKWKSQPKYLLFQEETIGKEDNKVNIFSNLDTSSSSFSVMRCETHRSSLYHSGNLCELVRFGNSEETTSTELYCSHRVSLNLFEISLQMDDHITIVFHHRGSFVTKEDGSVVYARDNTDELVGLDEDTMDVFSVRDYYKVLGYMIILWSVGGWLLEDL
ncbi:hypothetical protein Ahy_B10g102079 [Arachis hypogaea]|uniref:protein-serine/threonine phosphatase n=1 Tax=Arachis hypogaea TaxID=3818 RepID=A0A444X162_ARAHY|nr:hypothetical protein Ahy_B10g102079 [Arachis hypogaea]